MILLISYQILRILYILLKNLVTFLFINRNIYKIIIKYFFNIYSIKI